MFVVKSIILFVLGLSVGSFLNVLIFRMDNLGTVWAGRSYCFKCKHKLAWYDLIPVVSYATLLGKCRYCGNKISLQYPLVEIVMGLVFFFLFSKLGLNLSLFFYLTVFSILMVVVVSDIRTQLVPENFVWLALFLSFVGSWYFGGFGFLNMIWGGLIGGGLIGILVFVSREKWMGSGDIKIGLILGLLLGYPSVLFGLFAAFLLGAIVGLIYIGLSKKTLKDALPFAPFLIAGSLAGVIFGGAIMSWYWGSFVI